MTAEPRPTVLLLGERASALAGQLSPWSLVSRSGAALPPCDAAIVSDAPEVARLHLEAPQLPVIALAASAAEAVQLLEAGASDALVGPVEEAQVRARLGSLLRLCSHVAAAERGEVRRRTEQLFEALEEGIVELDARGVVLRANSAAARILDRRLTGLRLFEAGERVVDAQGVPVPLADLPSSVALREGVPVVGRVLGVHSSSGQLSWISMSAHALRGPSGEVSGVAASFGDVNSRRRLEQDREVLLANAEGARARAEAAQRDAEQAAQLKDQFLATLSHEMRTPLTSILGWVRLLQLGRASAEPGGRALRSIERNAQVQSQLVADLLDLQRITSGRMSLTFRDLELGTMLDAAVHGLAAAAEEAGVRLQVTRPIDEELHVFGDPDRLHQSITSLLYNAIKFSQRGGAVQATLQPMGTEVLLSVRDEGRGIEKNFVEHVFESFRQEDGTLSREKGGLGVGLSIVRHIVEMHSGTVRAESKGAGQGSYFTVMLPLRARVAHASRPPPAAPPSAPAANAFSGLQDLRVLVVEDDLDTQYLISAILEQAGARVSAAGSAAEGLGALRASRFDLLVSDISMPGEDGYSLIRRVRSGDAQPGIPAAALTANARHEDKLRALACGFQAHIAKPVEPAELVRLLARLAGSARTAGE